MGSRFHGAVTINPNDFPTTAERQAIEAAFTAWQNANTHSGVTFTFTTGTTDPNSTNTFYVNRGATQNGAATSVSNTGSPTTSGNITTHAPTTIDPRVTADHAIASFMAHEIGHTFGLGDCFSCNTGASMMSPPQRDCNCEYLPCDTNQDLTTLTGGVHLFSNPVGATNKRLMNMRRTIPHQLRLQLLLLKRPEGETAMIGSTTMVTG